MLVSKLRTIRRHIRSHRMAVLAIVALAGLPGASCTPCLRAQTLPVHGYITALHPPDGFELNGEHVITTPDTGYGAVNGGSPTIGGPMPATIQIGTWVEVYGPQDRKTRTVTAHTVLIRDDWARTLSSLGVITRVISTTPDFVMDANGFRVRVTKTTKVHFPRDLKSLAEVRAGVWVLYEGKMDQNGILTASKVQFATLWHPMEPPTKAADASLQAVEIDDQRKDIELDDNTYKIATDKALQARVQRIGMSLVPAYQKQLAEDDPTKIHFYFLPINNSIREEITSAQGLILVPAQLAARFKNDDQLAALLADGIAYSLQQQPPHIIQFSRKKLIESAVMGAAAEVPYGGVGTAIAYTVQDEKTLKKERERVALQLMAEAGYDPWQAPEAWRLAMPNKLPADTSKLKYPDRCGYQFSVLERIYKKPAQQSLSANTTAPAR